MQSSFNALQKDGASAAPEIGGRLACRIEQIANPYIFADLRDVYKELDAALKGGRKLRGEVDFER